MFGTVGHVAFGEAKGQRHSYWRESSWGCTMRWEDAPHQIRRHLRDISLRSSCTFHVASDALKLFRFDALNERLYGCERGLSSTSGHWKDSS